MDAAAHQWRCACCGEEFTGLPMAMGFEGPAGWDSLDDASRAESFLDSDFCMIVRPGGDIERYICGILPLPIAETDAEYQWTVWLSVSEQSWQAYLDGYGHGNYPVPGCFAYLMHEIPDFDSSLGLHADVWFQPEGLRPLVELHDGDHPLVNAQRGGIDISQIERWAARMHLGN